MFFFGGETGAEWVGRKTYSAFGHSCVNEPLSELVDSYSSSTCILIGSLFALSNLPALRTNMLSFQMNCIELFWVDF